jgi:hypothetical protein
LLLSLKILVMREAAKSVKNQWWWMGYEAVYWE